MGGATLGDPFAWVGRVVAATKHVVAQPEGVVFSPDSLTIKEGDRVVVDHPAGSQLHNIHWDDQANACPGDPTQDAWTCNRTFNKPGRFNAICDIHPEMTLTVRVLAGPTPRPPTPPPATPKATKRPTPPPPDPTPRPTVLPTAEVTAAATTAPTASPFQTGSPSPVATPAGTPAPVPTDSSGSGGIGPLLLLLGLVIAGALGGAALVRRRAAAPGQSAEV